MMKGCLLAAIESIKHDKYGSAIANTKKGMLHAASNPATTDGERAIFLNLEELHYSLIHYVDGLINIEMDYGCETLQEIKSNAKRFQNMYK